MRASVLPAPSLKSPRDRPTPLHTGHAADRRGQSFNKRAVDTSLTIQLLTGEHTDETARYLEAWPIRTVYMRGLIREHGIEDARNRGLFYACRARDGRMRGVAFIGNAILFTSDDEAATAAFADFARDTCSPRLIRGERGPVEQFWQPYARNRALCHTTIDEHLLVMREPLDTGVVDAPALRAATHEDLPLLVEVNAGMLGAEGGRNPLESDPEGFCRRLARRVEGGRVWVWREGERLAFKADIIAETPQAVYVEGVHVAPECRGRGVGLRCLSLLGRQLLARSAAICLTVRTDNDAARALYRKAGFQFYSEHATIYLRQPRHCAVA